MLEFLKIHERQRLAHFWKAESQGFPTSTIGASEDITNSSYERFEVVPPSAEIHKQDDYVS